jgi:photosystem II stability/assembly factor-like uncharacterized protein
MAPEEIHYVGNGLARNLFSIVLLSGVLLSGCEARLDLSGVQAARSRPTQRADLFQAAATFADTAVVVGGMGVIVTSTDRGRSWARQSLEGKPFLVDVSACPGGSFFAIDNADGLWARRPDGDWSLQALPEMTEPQALACDPNGVLWVSGAFSTILSSRDGGGDWESYSLDEDLYLTSIQFVDGLNGFVTGEFGVVLRTVDGGKTWERAEDLPDSFYPQAAYFTDAATGWVVGLNGTIWRTTDAARTWRQEPNDIKMPLYGVTGVGNALIAVGDNATIVYRPATEASWTGLDSSVGTRTYLRAITGLGDDQFLAAGQGVLFTGVVPQT